MSRARACAWVAAFVAIAAAAHAQSGGGSESGGGSIGAPQSGWLDQGVRLDDVPGLVVFATAHGHVDARFATRTLVEALVRAARAVAASHPGGTLTVSDMSREHGGPMRFHGSHASGRDADVLYYALDDAGTPIPGRYVHFDRQGRASDGGPERIDRPRTWAVIAALLDDADAHVEQIFVAPHVERMLLAAGRASGATPELLARAARMLAPPGTRGASPHDEHFHVRIACPAGQAACVERARDHGTMAPLPAGWAALLVRAEDQHDAYADGARVGTGRWYFETGVYARPAGPPHTIALRVEASRGEPGSVACELRSADGTLARADATWRVWVAARGTAPEQPPPAGWETDAFDDHDWEPAHVTGAVADLPRGEAPYFEPATPRVWSADASARVVYLRGHVP